MEDLIYAIAIAVARQALDKTDGKPTRLKAVHKLTDDDGVHGAKITVELTKDFVLAVRDELEFAQQEDNPTH